ncbi:hypothetical protein SODALDRAFT_331182 [Sodiomyces alkalinus F11]|uniref:PXA domain-containing protein n=1 Tax=Sodiomyces alkalinus (strain CBS 110278 / VKM F-3762 / F11) TaxID=1314773 RepID=A0A3N2Q3X1_SODAK|nr:hypothetical protein SODALDRAFT_331182 [Sodiomyces alkalinus F11]ROT41453.1 hypothetical protein SODALDRAFT_331182 [Sodiomyces alkalinus F11]
MTSMDVKTQVSEPDPPGENHPEETEISLPKGTTTNTKTSDTNPSLPSSAPSTTCALSSSIPSSSSPSPSPSEDDLLSKLFKFLSTATPKQLVGVGVGLAAATYVILGKLGLILMGAFGGVVLFISYEARHPEVSQTIRGESAIDVLRRLGLDKASDPSKENDAQQDERLIHSFDDFRPETRDALVGLVDAIIRDYVKWWYSPLLPSDSSFPLACRRALNSFLLSVSNALCRKRPADAFLDLLTNASSIVIVFLSELSAAYADVPADVNLSAPDAVYSYLADNPDSSLANLLNLSQQATKLRMVAEDLLQYLDRSSSNCDPARVFLREILAGVVLESSLRNCSRPEWINGWIVHLLEAGEPDFSQAIDEGMQTGPEAGAASAINHSAFVDIDGNVGNISLVKGNRNSFDLERARRKDALSHKKKLSKADEEMEHAVEEMRRMNAMIAQAERRSSKEDASRGTAGESTPPIKESMEEKSATGLPRHSEEEEDDEANHKPASTSGNVSPRSRGSLEKPSMDGSSKRGSLQSPITPVSSAADSQSRNSSPKQSIHRNSMTNNFTNFDQIVPPAKEEPEEAPGEGPRKPLLTLHNATITIYDDAANENEKARIKSKPWWDYLVQIEPASSHHPGWMIVRKYADFETLHEILRRIAAISGATAFAEQHGKLPDWKMHTRESLRGELERYVRDACWYQPLAESEGMKRFLDKDAGYSRGREEPKGVLGWDIVGKNMVDVLAMGSKGAVEGGKAVFGGVTGVFNNIGLGPRRQTASSPSEIQTQQPSRSSMSLNAPPRMVERDGSISPNLSSGPVFSPPGVGARKPRDSLDSQRSSVVSVQPGKMAPMERRPSYDARGEREPEPDGLKPRLDRWDRGPPSGRASREHSRASSLAALRSPLRSPSTLSLDGLRAFTPTEETHGFEEESGHQGDAANKKPGVLSRENSSASISSPLAQCHTFPAHSKPGANTNTNTNTNINTNINTNTNTKPNDSTATTTRPTRQSQWQYAQLSEQETRVAVELVFAVINEMYTLSSAWNIRRTLLAAAKSFLLRPGNPSLVSIQRMMQSSVLDGNTSDSGIAHHLRKLRENAMPTEEEKAGWPVEMSAEEKEKLRVKARRMLIERGVPAALSGVMGQAATTDALGRIFDCLQIEEVARGLMFGIMLQVVRVVTH